MNGIINQANCLNANIRAKLMLAKTVFRDSIILIVRINPRKMTISLRPLNRNNASADGIEAHLREQGISSKRKGGISLNNFLYANFS